MMKGLIIISAIFPGLPLYNLKVYLTPVAVGAITENTITRTHTCSGKPAFMASEGW